MAHHLLLLTTSIWMVFAGAIPDEYYLEDYLYDNYYDSDYDFSGPNPGMYVDK